MRNQPDKIVAFDPGHPLLSGADRGPKSELKLRKKLAQHTAVGAKDEAGTEPHDTRSVFLCFFTRAFPNLADAVRETALAAIELSQRFVLPKTVPSDCGA